MINRLHGEVESHELNDRLQTGHGRADADAGKPMLGDRGIDNPLRSEFLQQALRDLIGTLIFGDLFAHDEDVLVSAHLFGHGIAQRFANRRNHLRPGRNIRIRRGLGGRRCGYRRRLLLGRLLGRFSLRGWSFGLASSFGAAPLPISEALSPS